jgi:hypothetical protein
MKKQTSKNTKKLSLSKATLRKLSSGEIENVAGGNLSQTNCGCTWYGCSYCRNTCSCY